MIMISVIIVTLTSARFGAGARLVDSMTRNRIYSYRTGRMGAVSIRVVGFLGYGE